MPIFHLLLTLVVIIVWGVNFLFVKLCLHEISPLLLCALRFFFASIPAIFFIKPPEAPLKIVALYGLVMFALQFGLVFTGMQVGMTPGMASLIMQTQVFFSIFFAYLFLGERPNMGQIFGALVAFTGMGLVTLHFDATVTLLGFILLLGAAISWGLGNLIVKKINTNNFISVVVWGSFIAFPFMLLASLLFEGPTQISTAYQQISWVGIGSLSYIVYASTLIGYGLWNWLLGIYPVSTITPFTLLIPVVGILSSVIFLGEPFQLWKLVTCLLVVSGLCINLLSKRPFTPKSEPEAA